MRRAGSFSSVTSIGDAQSHALDAVIGQVHSNTLSTSQQALVQVLFIESRVNEQ